MTRQAKNKNKLAKRLRFAPCEGQMTMLELVKGEDLIAFLRECERAGEGAIDSQTYADAFEEAGKRGLFW